MSISSAVLAAATIGVMVIDTGFTPNSKVTHNVVYEKKEVSTHGTPVIYTMLRGVCEDVVVYVCGYTTELSEGVMLNCLSKADNLGVKYINISFNGSQYESKKERTLIKKLVDKGVKFTIASGNDGLNLDTSPRYPQSYAKEYNNIYVVGGRDLDKANTGEYVIKDISTKIIDAEGSVRIGTSFAAPKYMNKLLRQECERRLR